MIERLRALFGIGGASIREDLEDALDDTSELGDISFQERAMLKNVLNLHEVRVSDVMVPRADIVAVSTDDDLATVLKVFRTAGHSRIPVYSQTLDDPRGMIHIRDFFNCVAAAVFDGGDASAEGSKLTLETRLSSTTIVRPVLFVPPSMPALDLLIKMQAARTHMALVIDEYGGTDGLASIEDIVEVIVGDIEDEHDLIEGPTVLRTPDGFVVDARAHLDEVAAETQIDLSGLPHADDVETIGGLVTVIAGRVPAKGEVFDADDRVRFEVLDADPRRIKKLLLQQRHGATTAAAEATQLDGGARKTQSAPE
ncbi:MAG TPA: hemolysin family protein [Beijerinckiaceae bacterium]